MTKTYLTTLSGGALIFVVLLGCYPLKAQNLDTLGTETDAQEIMAGENGEREERPYELYLWRSYIFNSVAAKGGGQNLVFEGQIAPNLILYQNLHKSTKQRQVYSKAHNWVPAVSFSVTPMVRLRMFNDPSNPVRTPSYMPTFFTGQFFIMRRTQALENAPQFKRHLSPVEMFSATLVAQHHSNGQDGCLFRRQVRIDGECELAAGADPQNDAINRSDGSFSTNRLLLSLAYRRTKIDSSLRQRSSWYFGPRLELNPKWLPLPGKITDEIYPLYGPTRLRLFGGWETKAQSLPRSLRGQQWVEGWGEYLFDPLADDVSPFRFSLEAGFTLDKLNGLGAFVRFYSGQDYYNLGFMDELSLFQFGIVFSSSPAQSFELSSPSL